MEKYELKNIDGEDLVDLVSKIEGSLSIEFEDGELAHILTFGEFCDYILNKIELENSDDCTTQQAFYKLRKVIVTVLNIENKSVYPNTLLDDLFPRKSRIEDVRKIEDELGFKLNILEPPQFLTWILAITFLGSFILVFTMFEIGIIIFIFSLLSLRVNFKWRKNFLKKRLVKLLKK